MIAVGRSSEITQAIDCEASNSHISVAVVGDLDLELCHDEIVAGAARTENHDAEITTRA